MLVSPESMDCASAGGWSVRHTKMREALGEASVDMQALQVRSASVCVGRDESPCIPTLRPETRVERYTAQLSQQRVENNAGMPVFTLQP